MNSLDKICLGTVQLGMNYGVARKEDYSLERSLKILDHAWDKGIRHLDTATAYGKAIDVIARYHQQNPDKRFIINSKFRTEQLNKKIESHISEELSKLSICRYDVFMFHSWEDYLQDKALVHELKFLRGKLFSQLGVSIYTSSQLERAIQSGDFDFIQLPYNVLDNFSLKGEMLVRSAAMGIKLQARSIYLQGLLLMEQVPAALKDLKPAINRLKIIAEKYNMTLSSLCLAYVWQQPQIVSIALGVESAGQIDAAIDSIRNISKHLEPIRWMEEIQEIKIENEELLNPAKWKLT